MARVPFYFIACLVVLPIVSCIVPRLPGRKNVINVGEQCRSRGPYGGACNLQNFPTDEFGCMNLVCAHQHEDGDYYAVSTGTANDGTPCGNGKACSKGVCVQSPIPSEESSQWLAKAGFLDEDICWCISPARSALITNRRGPVKPLPSFPNLRY